MNNVEIINLDHKGRGIAYLNNKIVFIKNALPGEIVNIEILVNKKKYMEAEVKEYVKISDKRQKPICPYFSVCGGCDLMHLSYQDQLLYKEQKVKEMTSKYLHKNIKINSIVKADESLFYRNKVSFQVDKEIGLYEQKSNSVIPVEKCFIADCKINDLYNNVKQNVKLANVKQVIIKATKNTNESMIIFDTLGKIDEQNVVDIFKNKVNSLIVKSNDKYKTIYGSDRIVETMGENKFVISPSSFFQINTNQAINLYNQVLQYAEINDRGNILDLYCGTGTIAIMMSKNNNRVLGIEINKDAIIDANKNKELNNISNVSFIAGDASLVLEKTSFISDTIIVDPPRSGLNQDTINQILKYNPKKIIYVSCDPMTLMRDLNKLSINYNIKELTPLDMFPQTSHVECVVLLYQKQ